MPAATRQTKPRAVHALHDGAAPCTALDRAQARTEFTPDHFTTGVWIHAGYDRQMIPVGIDLFARRCIEGGRFEDCGAPVTYPPQLAKETAAEQRGIRAL